LQRSLPLYGLQFASGKQKQFADGEERSNAG
jgi:hypothetical protein